MQKCLIHLRKKKRNKKVKIILLCQQTVEFTFHSISLLMDMSLFSKIGRKNLSSLTFSFQLQLKPQCKSIGNIKLPYDVVFRWLAYRIGLMMLVLWILLFRGVQRVETHSKLNEMSKKKVTRENEIQRIIIIYLCHLWCWLYQFFSLFIFS